MSFRLAGLMIGLALLGQFVVRRSHLTRGEILTRIGVIAAVWTFSLYPAAAGLLADTLQLRNRLLALLVASVIGLTVTNIRVVRRFNDLEDRFGLLVRNLAIRELAKATSGRSHVSIVIPAYNEAEAIEGVLRELPTAVCGLKVEPVVVVDGGEDQTEAIVRAAGHTVVTHPINRGQGDALRTGFRYAILGGASVVVTMDADGQHDPAELERLVGPIVRDEADYVQGSRFLGQYDDAGSVRHAGIRVLTMVVNTLARLSITDCTNGYRAIAGSALAALRLEEDKFSAAEILIEVGARKLRLQEVPVHVRHRSHGESKKPARMAYPLGYLHVAIRAWARQRALT